MLECRDVTPDTCAAAHPDLKAIEASSDSLPASSRGRKPVVDFLYMLVSPGMRLKIHDYLPNTTLESGVTDDSIEVAETTEASGKQ